MSRSFKALMVLLMILLGSFARAEDGTSGGGGGTFVLTPHSNRLVFWDLYLNNPGFSDPQAGDRLQPRSRPHSSTSPADWIDYRTLKSFAFLKSRLRQWQERAPYLIDQITDRGILLRDAPDPQGFYYLLLATPLYIQKIDQIAVPQNFDTSTIRALPGAYFIPESERIFVSIPIFNKAGLISQAAMLLHERMRDVQLDYNISNRQLQSLVYMILMRDPDQVSPGEYDDLLFSPRNYRPQLVDKGSLAQYFGRFGYDMPKIGRAIYRMNTEVELMKVEDAFQCANSGQSCRDAEPFASADAEAKLAVDLGLLGPKYVSDVGFRSVGINVDDTPVDHFTDVGPGVVLDASNCKQVLASSVDPTYINTFRSPLDCSGGWMNGSGRLLFTSALSDRFDVEVVAKLYTGNDGGSEIAVEALGATMDLHNEGGPLGNGLSGADSKRLHAYVFRFDFQRGTGEVVLNDDGNYRNNPPVQQWQIRPGLSHNHKRIDWNYTNANLTAVKSIKILDPNAPVISGRREIGVFENWETTNSEDEGYIARAGEQCKFGYASEFMDPASRRQECVRQYDYNTRAGEKCGPGYVTLYFNSADKTAQCRSLRKLENYETNTQEPCAKGFRETGTWQGSRVCTNPSLVNIYYLRDRHLHDACATGFSAFDDRAGERRCERNPEMKTRDGQCPKNFAEIAMVQGQRLCLNVGMVNRYELRDRYRNHACAPGFNTHDKNAEVRLCDRYQ